VVKRPSHNPERRSRTGKVERPTGPAADSGTGLGGFLGKIGVLVEKLGELAEAGEEFSRSGEIEGLDPRGKLRGMYGFTVRTGLGQEGRRQFKVEPFGNIRRRPGGKTVVDQLREPPVDVHIEEDHVLVVAEIPGASRNDVKVELCGDRLTISARHRQARYRKEVALPQAFSAEKMRWRCKNGILSVRLER
jgi:HSP20 family protein